MRPLPAPQPSEPEPDGVVNMLDCLKFRNARPVREGFPQEFLSASGPSAPIGLSLLSLDGRRQRADSFTRKD